MLTARSPITVSLDGSIGFNDDVLYATAYPDSRSVFEVAERLR